MDADVNEGSELRHHVGDDAFEGVMPAWRSAISL